MLRFQEILFGNRPFGEYPEKNYPTNLIDLCKKSFLNNFLTPKASVKNLPKRNVFIKLPFLCRNSFQIRKSLQKLFTDELTFCNLKVVFASSIRVTSFFT